MDGPRSPVGVEAATQDLAWSSSVFLVSLHEPLVQKNPPLTRFAVTHDSWGGALCVADGAHPPSPNLFMRRQRDRQTK